MKPTSPCVQNCKLYQGKCIGCKRTLIQIKDWSRMTEQQREVITKQLKGK